MLSRYAFLAQLAAFSVRWFLFCATFLVEQLESRCLLAAAQANLLVTNAPLTLDFSAATYTSPNPAISGTLSNATNSYFLNQSPSTGNVKLNGSTMLLNNAGSEAHIADFAAGHVVFTYTGSLAYIGGSTDAFIMGNGNNTQTSFSVFPSQAPTAPSLDKQFVAPNTPGAVVGDLSSSNSNGIFGFNDPVTFSVTTPNSPFQIGPNGVLELKPGQSIGDTTTVTVQANNTIYSSQSASTTIQIATLAITSQPQSKVINVGQSATLSETAVASTGFSVGYQWLSSLHGDNNFAPIDMATDASYTTPVFLAAGAMDYEVDTYLIDNSNPDNFINGDLFSNVATVTATVPEPAPLTLLVSAVLVIGGTRLRQRRRLALAVQENC